MCGGDSTSNGRKEWLPVKEKVDSCPPGGAAESEGGGTELRIAPPRGGDPRKSMSEERLMQTRRGGKR